MYNFGSVSLAAIGWLHPLAAALLMPVSSFDGSRRHAHWSHGPTRPTPPSIEANS